MRCFRGLAAGLISAFFGLSALVAEEPKDTLEALGKRIEEEQSSLSALKEEEKGLVAAVAKSKKEYDAAAAAEKNILKEIAQVRKDEEALQSEFEKLILEDESLRKSSANRIRSLAKKRPDGFLHLLLLGGSSSELSREVYLLRRIRTFDAKLLKHLGNIKEEMEISKTRLNQLREERIGLLGEVAKKKEGKEKTLKEHNGFLESLRERRNGIEVKVSSLRAEALRLESALRTLTVEEEPKSSATVPEAPTPSPHSPGPRRESSQFAGDGLKGVRLIQPIDGKVVKRFGASNSSSFTDILFKKGTEFVAQEGTSPRSVSRGLVLFAGVLPGYGGVAIIDHGARIYTLYGKLKSIKVKQGEVVEQGAPLGVTPPLGTDRSNFYFEVRSGSQAVDPASYFGKGFKKAN